MEKARPLILIIAIMITFFFLNENVKNSQPQRKQDQAAETAKQTHKRAEPLAANNTIQQENTTALANAAPAFAFPKIDIVDDIVLSNKNVSITLSNNGAVLRTAKLQTWFEDLEETVPLTVLDDVYGKGSFGISLNPDSPPLPWYVTEKSETSVTFSRPDAAGVTLTKTFTVAESGDLEVVHTIQNTSAQTVTVTPRIDGPTGTKIVASALIGQSSNPFVYGILEDDSINLDGSDLKEIKKEGYSANVRNQLQWLALRSKYFVSAAILKDPQQYEKVVGSYISSGNQEDLKESIATTVIATSITLDPSQTASYSMNVYNGPIRRDLFQEDGAYASLHPLADLGKLAPICLVLIAILNFFYTIVGNYGFAILCVTIFVKAFLHPLTAKGMRSMYAMQKLAPKLKELKERYGDDRQKFGMKQMELFKKEQVNPLMGCLPLLLQMPVYFALYTTLTRVIEIRHANFLWIGDLAKPDAFVSFNSALPLLGTTFNLLPFLWMISMFVQQKMTPKSPDPNMAQQQKIMQFIPFVFGFMMYSMPSGLMVYWVAQNVFSIIEQAQIRKKYGPAPHK